jgi:hypothetical protein
MIDLGAIRAQYRDSVSKNNISFASRLQTIRENIFKKNTSDTIDMIERHSEDKFMYAAYYISCPTVLSENIKRNVSHYNDDELESFYKYFIKYTILRDRYNKCDQSMLDHVNKTMSEKFENYKIRTDGKYVTINTE